MKALLLYNNKSGKGRIGKHMAKIREIFAEADIEITPREIDFSVSPFEGAEDAELVVVCGGDGTVNFVVNAMMSAGLNITLGVIPSGTANDFAGAIGMKRGILAAARQIATGEVKRVDCGKANNKYFVNILSFGVFTTTSQHTSDAAKHRIGKLAYLSAGVADFINLHKIPITVRYDDKELTVDAAMFLAFNGRSAGQFKLAPTSSIEDGLLDILILDYKRRMRTCWNMMSYLISHESEAVHHIQCKKLELYCEIDEETDIDGQPGPRMPLSVECLAGALNIKA